MAGPLLPAAMEKEMADGQCESSPTQCICPHRVRPKTQTHSTAPPLFCPLAAMKKEMDDTKWGDTLAARLKDW